MGESQMHDAKSKNTALKTYTLCSSIYMTIWKRQKYRNREKIGGCRGLGISGQSEYNGQREEILWGSRIVLHSVCAGSKNPDTCKNSHNYI